MPSNPTTQPVLAVLGYHKIGPPSLEGWDSWYYVPESIFEAQLRYIHENGWTVIDAATLLAGLADPDILPAKAAVVTFDDAYRSVLTHALPHMQEHGFPGIIFAPTQFIGGLNLFDANTRHAPEQICNWEELKQLQQAGLSIHSHSVSHRGFSRLSAADIEQEASISKAVLEERLGSEVSLFAYPLSDPGESPELHPIMRQVGYRAAFMFTGGPILQPISDIYRLPRIPIWRDSDLDAALVQGGAQPL